MRVRGAQPVAVAVDVGRVPGCGHGPAVEAGQPAEVVRLRPGKARSAIGPVHLEEQQRQGSDGALAWPAILAGDGDLALADAAPEVQGALETGQDQPRDGTTRGAVRPAVALAAVGVLQAHDTCWQLARTIADFLRGFFRREWQPKVFANDRCLDRMEGCGNDVFVRVGHSNCSFGTQQQTSWRTRPAGGRRPAASMVTTKTWRSACGSGYEVQPPFVLGKLGVRALTTDH